MRNLWELTVTAHHLELASLRTDARELVSGVQDWLTDLSVVEWVLLAFAAAVAYWTCASAWAATRLGAIEVESVEHDDPDATTAEVHARTSLLRESIADAGLLPPPGVPGGAPQADLLAAVETSPIPQANWIATLLKLVPWPKPSRYLLGTTLLHKSPPCGARIWLRSSGGETPLLATLGAANVADGLARVPAAVFAHVSDQAVHVFPIWARWEDEWRLRLYLDGIRAVKAQDAIGSNAAKTAFKRAAMAQPSNALARLRLANLRENKAAGRRFDDHRTVSEAGVLRLYLDLAIERRELVEARYRASVLAARVAHDLPAISAQDQVKVRAALRMEALTAEALALELHRLADRELNRALALVQPWFVPLIWHRLRYAVEPKGFDRRRLKRTFGLAKHCQFARTVPDEDTLGIRIRIRWRTWLVRLAASRPTSGWQAYYTAASFFALLAARRKRMGLSDGS